MISVDQALEAVLARFAPLPAVESPILDVLGQVVAEDVRAGFDVPPLTNAAMDGYAVRAADVAVASEVAPVALAVVEDLPAGRCAVHRVEPGTAIRIMTGAPLPDGADAVVPFELTDEARGATRRSRVRVFASIRPGTNIRLAGEDVRRGEVMLPAGTTIRPAEVGLLATMGRATVPVHRRPRVAILSTGDEVLEPGEPLAPGKIYDANSFTVAAMVRCAGGVPIRLGVARDRVDDLIARVERLDQVDLLVTSAGVSVGDYDVVKQALTTAGEVTFYQVRMRPGRPLAFGHLRGVPLLGLPGNPVASAISFELFGRPAVMRMLGRSSWARQEITARFDGAIDNYDGRRSFYRVSVERGPGGFVARLTGPQGSGILTSMVKADGLMVIPEDRRRVGPGEEVVVRLLDA
ncbi:MAG TPA: gephyrin-like molybdotransferase Glp [Chloroflexota bacterium]|nr:gephyrin-like molybdotransferase Glp [Chloroflexota bacterium]